MAIVVFVGVMSAHAEWGIDWKAAEWALGQIESGEDDGAVGRDGERSRYQILPLVWERHEPNGGFADRAIAWRVARRILEDRAARFHMQFHRWPDVAETYWLWNAPGQVFERAVSRRVQGRGRRFANLYGLRART